MNFKLINNIKLTFFNFSYPKLTLSLIFISCASGQQTGGINNNYSVSGIVEYSGTYCGGAYPGLEAIKRIKRKRAYQNFKIYVRKGTYNSLYSPIIDSCVTDSTGKFSFSLPNGNYILLSKYQIDKSIFKQLSQNKYIAISDEKCLENWWTNGLMKITINNHPIDTLSLHFQGWCFTPTGVPYIRYFGPRPP